MSTQNSDALRSMLLTSTLEAAVPLWIEKFKLYPFDEIMIRARTCAQFIAEHGDNILYKSKKPGDTAAAFNRLAEGLACAAFMPGGIKFMGLHFEATHPEAESR